MAVLSWLVYLVTCWTTSSPCLKLQRILCVTLASTTTSLICSGTCIGYGFRKEYSSDWPYWLSAVITTRRLRILLMSSIGLTRRNHGIDYGLVPFHAWSFREPRLAPSATDHFVWLSHVHGTHRRGQDLQRVGAPRGGSRIFGWRGRWRGRRPRARHTRREAPERWRKWGLGRGAVAPPRYGIFEI